MSYFNYLLNRSLAHVKRFNTKPQHFPESVAEHSFYVAHFTSLICKILEQNNIKIDQKKALELALIHDMEEGFSGDIINPFKHFNQKVEKAIQEVNRETINMMFAELPSKTSRDYIDLWHEEQKRATIESQVVKVADSLSLISKCFEEIESGNSFFQEIYKKEIKKLKSLEWKWWTEIKKEILAGADKET